MISETSIQHTVSFCIYTKNADDKWNFVSNLVQFVRPSAALDIYLSPHLI